MVHTSQDAVPCGLLIACIFPCVHLYIFLIYRLLYIIIILEQNSIRIFLSRAYYQSDAATKPIKIILFHVI